MLKRLRKPKSDNNNYKCYRCGYESTKEEKYCPKCLEKELMIHMIIKKD